MTGLLTKDLEYGGGFFETGNARCHLAEVNQLIQRLHGGNVQGEVLIDGDASRQRRIDVSLLLATL